MSVKSTKRLLPTTTIVRIMTHSFLWPDLERLCFRVLISNLSTMFSLVLLLTACVIFIINWRNRFYACVFANQGKPIVNCAFHCHKNLFSLGEAENAWMLWYLFLTCGQVCFTLLWIEHRLEIWAGLDWSVLYGRKMKWCARQHLLCRYA